MGPSRDEERVEEWVDIICEYVEISVTPVNLYN